jgi:hypothetical protein
MIKFTMARSAFEKYGLPKNPKINSLRDFAEFDPSVRFVLNSPFAFYFVWSYCHSAPSDNYWRTGMTAEQKEKEYREVYSFADYLLTTFANTEKTFLLGHWEGDWSLLGGFDKDAEPTEIAIRGMVDWLNIRQRAIADARRARPDSKTSVYGYTEVNLVGKAMEGKKTVTNNVLPSINVDYVSYSCWDSLDLSQGEEAMTRRLSRSLDYIESRMKRHPGRGKRVFVGEFGFPFDIVKTQQAQAHSARVFLRAALQWGCPFILYWQVYENEAKEGENGRGEGLIDHKGRKTVLYSLLEDYLRAARSYVEHSTLERATLPTQSEFQRIAVQWMSQSKRDQVESGRNSIRRREEN